LAPPAVRKIVSGGQTGVDRGALDAAIEVGIEHGGCCPRGRRAEDGRIAPRYRLTETESAAYSARTERNVADSDGTLILCRGKLAGGTSLTRRVAERLGKPCLVVDLAAPTDASQVREWISRNELDVLNVAGPRESQAPGIQSAARAFVLGLLR